MRFFVRFFSLFLFLIDKRIKPLIVQLVLLKKQH